MGLLSETVKHFVKHFKHSASTIQNIESLSIEHLPTTVVKSVNCPLNTKVRLICFSFVFKKWEHQKLHF